MGCGASSGFNVVRGESTPVSLLDDGKRQKVTGVVEAAESYEVVGDGLFPAMIGGANCVYCKGSVRKDMPAIDGKDKAESQTYTQENSVDFVVRDETGAVMIKPSHIINWEDGVRDQVLTEVRFRRAEHETQTWDTRLKIPGTLDADFQRAATRSKRQHRGIFTGAILSEMRVVPGDVVTISGRVSALGASGGIVTTISSDGIIGDGSALIIEVH